MQKTNVTLLNDINTKYKVSQTLNGGPATLRADYENATIESLGQSFKKRTRTTTITT